MRTTPVPSRSGFIAMCYAASMHGRSWTVVRRSMRLPEFRSTTPIRIVSNKDGSVCCTISMGGRLFDVSRVSDFVPGAARQRAHVPGAISGVVQRSWTSRRPSQSGVSLPASWRGRRAAACALALGITYPVVWALSVSPAPAAGLPGSSIHPSQGTGTTEETLVRRAV
jgi:hypothetical protein